MNIKNNGSSYTSADGRTKCEVWTRTMGYYRPVSGYNIGKKSEFISRKYFNEQIALSNQEFKKQYE